MSQTQRLFGTLDFCCPYCEEYNEIDDIEVSVIIDYTDQARNKDECEFTHKCTYCEKKFKIIPHLDITVRKVD